MCDPVTITMAASAGIGAVSSLVGGFQQAEAYQMQSQVAERSAVMEERSGAYAARRIADANKRALDAMRGQYLAGGFALTGSPAAVIEDSAAEGSLDEQAVKYDARIRADNARFEARLARHNKTSAQVGAVLGAASSAVNGWARNVEYKESRTRLTNPYAVA